MADNRVYGTASSLQVYLCVARVCVYVAAMSIASVTKTNATVLLWQKRQENRPACVRLKAIFSKYALSNALHASSHCSALLDWSTVCIMCLYNFWLIQQRFENNDLIQLNNQPLCSWIPNSHRRWSRHHIMLHYVRTYRVHQIRWVTLQPLFSLRWLRGHTVPWIVFLESIEKRGRGLGA